MSKILLGLFILLFVFIKPVHAEHNPNPTGKDRGYNQKNCLSLSSKTTGKQAEWLGHIVGCMVEDKNKDGEKAYVLIQEYSLKFLSFEDGTELRLLSQKYALPDELGPHVDWADQI